jgi:hypothetical protein
MEGVEFFPIIIFSEVRVIFHSGVGCFPTFGTFGSKALLFPITKVDVNEILNVGERFQEISSAAFVKRDSYEMAILREVLDVVLIDPREGLF